MEEQFFRWICQQVKEIRALPASQQLREHEQVSEHGYASGEVDPEMQEVVAAWSTLPGVGVTRSCQGAGGVFHFGEKTLLAPSRHKEWTMLELVVESEAQLSAVNSVVAAYPSISFGRLALQLRPPGQGKRLEAHLRGEHALENEAVRADLVHVAEQVKARWWS